MYAKLQNKTSFLVVIIVLNQKAYNQPKQSHHLSL